MKGHFILRGPPDSPYVGGEYHGVINVSLYSRLFTAMADTRTHCNSRVCAQFPSDYPYVMHVHLT